MGSSSCNHLLKFAANPWVCIAPWVNYWNAFPQKVTAGPYNFSNPVDVLEVVFLGKLLFLWDIKLAAGHCYKLMKTVSPKNKIPTYKGNKTLTSHTSAVQTGPRGPGNLSLSPGPAEKPRNGSSDFSQRRPRHSEVAQAFGVGVMMMMDGNRNATKSPLFDVALVRDFSQTVRGTDWPTQPAFELVFVNNYT